MTNLLTYLDSPEPVHEGEAITVDDIRALGRVMRAAIGAGIPVARFDLDPGLVVAHIDCPEERAHLAHRLGLGRRSSSGGVERFTDADARVVVRGPLADEATPTIHDLYADEADRRYGIDREARVS
ncbi:hypothetical protein N866_13555 [Actinotalea ferrariae CF5-4]|uniref:Uncharacterized protein n=1 Tax=Actinotalea ferrariae CF5-4 TaxID=948458 RepID=A0A021VSZ1_9CELL|nr:hypothetical protein [Actinotalea ferrariae]EYR64271.1 hypothetical protein N866_13555 [Actinotalea ferrariae CF5-4]